MTTDRIECHELENQSQTDSDADTLYRQIIQDMPEPGELTYLEKAGRHPLLSLVDRIEESISINRQKHVNANVTK